MKYRKLINNLEFVLGILCFVYYLLCVLDAGFHISILYVWIFMGIALVAKSILCHRLYDRQNRALKLFVWFADIITMLAIAAVLVFGTFVYAGMKEAAPADCDYVVVLGGGVNVDKPSSALRKRIDCACKYLSENPDTKVIGTGGKSQGDKLSEGACIAKELEYLGIAPERITYEEKSTTTVENFKYAAELIDEDAKNIVIVSSGFHISRAKMIAANFIDKEIYGIAATNEGILTLHYMIREFIVFHIDILQGNYCIFP